MTDISSINQVLAEMRRLTAAAQSAPLDNTDKYKFRLLLHKNLKRPNLKRKTNKYRRLNSTE